MPSASGKINDRERKICSRLKEIREIINVSQQRFAGFLELTRDKVASIECGRTPLRYDIAWLMRGIMGVNLDWLATGKFEPTIMEQDYLLAPSQTGLPLSALLSEVYDTTKDFARDLKADREAGLIPKIDRAEIHHRLEVADRIRQNIDAWIVRLPDGKANDFFARLKDFSEAFARQFPPEQPDAVRLRREAMLWAKKGKPDYQRIFAGVEVSKKPLTDDTLKSTNDSVKPEIQKLIARVNSFASKPGTKAELARILDVAPARVSEWLRGKKEPGGDFTLRLLKWVEQQERK